MRPLPAHHNEVRAARVAAPRPTNQTDFTPKPPYVARGPEEEAAASVLPAGYRMELVASDPDVISPAVIEFDGNGRMYVASWSAT